MRWGLSLALISGAYYEIHAGGNHDTRWWYDEYDGGKGIRRRGYLGLHAANAIELRANIWRRNFEHGVVLNNSSSTSVTIDLKQSFRRLRGTQSPRVNNGRIVRRVTIPGHDGLILLNVEPKPKK